MPRTAIPLATVPLDGTETLIGVQDGKKRQFEAATFRGPPGDESPPFRVARFSGTAGANGQATITFDPPFTAVQDVGVVPTWSGQQVVMGGVLSFSNTGCTVAVMRSRGTLALSAGPFEAAPSGTTVQVRAYGY